MNGFPYVPPDPDKAALKRITRPLLDAIGRLPRKQRPRWMYSRIRRLMWKPQPTEQQRRRIEYLAWQLKKHGIVPSPILHPKGVRWVNAVPGQPPAPGWSKAVEL